MNASEVRDLLFKIAAYKPAQRADPATAPAWLEAVQSYSWEDCNRAVMELAVEVEWIGVQDVVQRVKHYRNGRIGDSFADLVPPRELADDPAGYAAWSRSVRRRLGDGESVESINGPQPVLPVRAPLQALETRRRVAESRRGKD